jgi:GGDEF domain-containing protein
MGNARFALLLPATSYPVATSLAEHISYSLENLHLSGPEGPVTVSTGIAEASQPAQVSELLGIATNSLVRSLIREDGRRRPWTATGGLAADC